MDINFNKVQKRLIKKFVARFHGKERVDTYKVFMAIAYIVYTGCQWHMLPHYFPPYTTVYYHFRKWSEFGALNEFLSRLVKVCRKRRGRKPSPTVVVIDSQSVRSGYAQSEKGVDGFKRVKGIKRQIAVDSNGFPLCADVTRANVHDSKGVDTLLNDCRLYYDSISLVKADKGYQGVDTPTDDMVVECVKSNFGTSEFRPISGRWVVERTNAWLETFRRLCRNYERYLSTARAMTYFASIIFMLKYF